jgi:uncharacterized membrane protein
VTDWIVFWLVASVILALVLFIENIFLFVTIRKPILFEFRLWFLRSKGYGIHRIIHKDRAEEYRIVKLHNESLDRKGFHYMFDSQGFTHRLWDRAAIATHKDDIPTQMDLMATSRFYNVSPEDVREYEQEVVDDKGVKLYKDGVAIMQKAYMVKLPRADWNTQLTAKKIASYLVKMRFMAKDFFKKYYIIILVAIGVGILATWYFNQQTADAVAKMNTFNAQQFELLKAMISQQKVVNIP